MSDPYDLAPEGDASPRPPRPPASRTPTPGTAWSPAPTLGYAGPRTSLYGTPKPNGWRAKTAAILALVLAGLNALALLLEVWDYQQLEQAIAGTLTAAQEEQLIAVALVFLAVYAVVVILFLVFFFMWLYRAVKNVRIATGDSRSGPGMSVGWWFIPFANLVMPYLVLKDLWERARVSSSAPWVGIFWTLWIGGGIVDRIADRMYGRAIEAGELSQAQSMVFVGAFGLAAGVLAYLLLAKIVRDVQRHQEPQSM